MVKVRKTEVWREKPKEVTRGRGNGPPICWSSLDWSNLPGGQFVAVSPKETILSSLATSSFKGPVLSVSPHSEGKNVVRAAAALLAGARPERF